MTRRAAIRQSEIVRVIKAVLQTGERAAIEVDPEKKVIRVVPHPDKPTSPAKPRINL